MATPLWDADDIRDSDGELECYAISQRSRKLCLAMVDFVGYISRWKGSVTQDEIDVWLADLTAELIGDSNECAPGIDEDLDCTNYMPDALFIDYAPNDPFQTPDLVPEGYLFVPPWYSNPGVPLPGVIPTDAMVNFLAIGAFGDLFGLIESGLPRFHIDIDGEGEVELEFVKVPQGGNVLIVQDGDPLQQQVFDLNALQLGELGTLEDLFDIVIEESLNDTAVCEVHFATPGLHTIDVTFFPNIASDVIVGMGGGLRRVSLCGVAPEAEVSMPQFQVVDCVLQWRPNGSAAWADLVDLCAVQPPTIVRQDPTPPGNMQQNIGGAGYTDIADSDFLWRNGLYPMTGGLEIYPTSTEVGLIARKTTHSNPYNIAEFQRADGGQVDRVFYDGEIGHDTTLGGLDGFSIYGGGYSVKYGSLTRASILNVTDAAFTLMGKVTGRPFQMLAFDASTATIYCVGKGGAVKNQIWRKSNIIDYDNAWIGADGDGHFGVRNSANDIPDGVTINKETTGAGGTGSGIALKIVGKSSTTSALDMARLYAAWETPTHATRAAKVVLSVYDYSGEKTLIEGGVTGANTPKIGFLGITPQPRLAISGDHHKNAMTKQIVEALALFGLVTDATTDTESFVIAGETGGFPLFDEIIDSLEAYSDYFVDATSPGECEIVCEVPPPEFWCKEFDFDLEEDRAPWVIERGIVGTGFESTLADEMVFIHTAQFETFRIIDVTIIYDQSGSVDATVLFGAYDFGGYTSHDWGNVPPGAGQEVSIDYSPSYDAFSGFRIVATSTDPFQQVRIRGLKVFGYDMGIYGVIEAGTDCP